MANPPIAAGKSSFDLVDFEKLVSEIDLKDGMTLLDAACGIGNYTVAMAERVAQNGRVIAVDLWHAGIDRLRGRIQAKGIHNVFAEVVDISRHIPLEKGAVQVCLMATVFHDLVQDGTDQGTLMEIRRVLESNGVLAIIEFKEMDGPPGPPIHIRISPEALEERLAPFGFVPVKTVDVGPTTYLSLFSK